jgi:ribonuclease P protein component
VPTTSEDRYTVPSVQASFPRTARLTGAVDFKRVFAEPQRIGSRGFVLLVRPNAEDRSRLGLAISKRYAARAVDRNRLKRLARESFRLNAARLPAVDVVILCGPGAPDIPNGPLRAALDQAWKTIGNQSWVA